MSERRHEFTAEETRRIGEEIGIDWASARFDVDQLRIGMNVELEHGLHDPNTNVSDDNPHVTAKIALAHLNADGGRSQARLGAAPLEEQPKGDTRRRQTKHTPGT